MQKKPEIPEKLLKPYNPSETEDRIYKLWEESGFFNPDVCVEKSITDADAEPFSMVLPPPNVTGMLHLGHSFEDTIEDVVVRYNRMCGKKTVWIPGTDHAAIATQAKVEKLLEKEEGKRKHELGREEFLKRVDAFAKDSHDTIVSQLRKMGSSLDWSREAFTLDKKRERAVYTAFKRMYDDGLIYRGYRVVNWDPKGQTTISDDEIVYEERQAKLYTFKYNKDFPIPISTTRPETKLGDTAVAVHPDDARYKKYVGKTYEVADFCGAKLTIKIIADESVEKDFGTGALGVTPAHSMADWEMAQRHDLPLVPVINEFAKMTLGNEKILGKKTTEAREAVVEWLRNEGLLEKEEEITQNISTAERTGGIVEPLPKLQWFVNVNKSIPIRDRKTLKELMLEPIKNADIKILPDRFENVYYNWVNNLRDWCISRQIWYGHRIPVWYDEKGTTFTQKETTVYLARHGECEANVSEILHSQAESDSSPLTGNGKKQSHELGEKMRSNNIVKIICSPLLRSRDTASIAAKELGIPPDKIEVWDELYEVKIGDEKIGTPRPKNFNLLRVASETTSGETMSEVEQRAKHIVQKIEALETNGNVLIVGHGSFNAALRALLQGVPKEGYPDYRDKIGKLSNGSSIELKFLQNPNLSNLTQDSDTLDTWFSSGLWTFSTLGWPDETPDLKTFHPTSVIMPGYEILFFWVARMILMSQYLLGEIPFRTVYLHGIVRDSKGKKFSKSSGNGVDPIEVIGQFGADALRMSLVVGVGPGNDMKFDIQKVKAYKLFANKIWNISRFVLENTEGETLENGFEERNQFDEALRAERKAVFESVTDDMENFRFHIAAEKLYNYVWHTFADKILEESKIILSNGTPEEKIRRKQFLLHTLNKILRALHPFMPFVTEEIWSMLPARNASVDEAGGPQMEKKMLMVEKWPI